MFTRTPRLRDSHTIMGTKRLTQPDISAVNLDKSSSMTGGKGMDPVEVSSAALHLPPEVGIKQVGKS